MNRVRFGGLLLSVAMMLSFGFGALAQEGTPAPGARTSPPPEVPHGDAKTKVAVVPGGPHPYFAPMEGALAAATTDFGLDEGAFKAPTEWKLDAQNELIETLVAQGYNAFAIFPGDANGSNSTIEELMDEGIPTALVGGCTTQPTMAQFCIATDVANSAYLGTKALIDSLGGEGTIVHFTGLLVDPNTKLRMEAVERAVAETGGKVQLLQHLTDVDSQEEADNKINALLAASKDEIDGIITTAYIPSVVAATALRSLGDKRIKMVGIDDDPIVLQAITDGFLVGTMAQNPYGQAYIAAYALDRLRHDCQMKEDAPYLIDSGTFLIDAAKVSTYQEDLKTLTRDIQTRFPDSYLSCG
ncbi:MAG: ribose transport system substrate-binding protein [Thermomicrobiales bacterium]|nr:ribose transport system substrate-binding protein [Thermomicrobiales bacterium]